MYYKEYLRVRRVFIGFGIALFSIAVLVVLLTGHVRGSLSMAHPDATNAMVAAAASTDANHAPTVGVQINGDSDKAPVEVLFAIAGFIAAIFATVVGCALASDNCGHLEVAWTRPASRAAYALQTAFVDWVGILTMFAFVLLLCGIIVAIEGWWPHLHIEPASMAIATRMFVFPFAWYGLVAALTASMRGGAGLVCGLSWPVASVAIVLEKLQHPHSIFAGILAVINTINPLLYTSFNDTESSAGSAVHALVGGQTVAVAALACIAVGGVAVSLLQWRRLEA